MDDEFLESPIRYARARQLVQGLRDLWGDEMPPTPDPALSILHDAVVLDDEAGRGRGLVVQGDGLSYEVLGEVLAEVLRRLPGAEAPLPVELLGEIRAALGGGTGGRFGAEPLPGPDPGPGPPGPLAPLLPRGVGTWELELRSARVVWDAECAELLHVEDSGAPLAQQLSEVIHPDDRHLVERSLSTTFTTGLDYDVRFRTRRPRGGWVWQHGSGRVLRLPDGDARIVGLLSRAE